MEKSFERQYAINVARLKPGKHTDSFHLGEEFFSEFELKAVQKPDIQADLAIVKYETHLDVSFHITGPVEISCDRCGAWYSHSIDSSYRIIYSFDKNMSFEGYEVMYVNPQEPSLVLVQELYDFVVLSIPVRKVPSNEVHLCPPEVLKVLGLNEKGELIEQEENTEEIDPRWEALKQFKDRFN
ncbi:MAG: DUF177 domain-containing protein [Bacteroidota bacterium]